MIFFHFWKMKKSFSFFPAEKMRGVVEELPINEIEVVVAFEEEEEELSAFEEWLENARLHGMDEAQILEILEAEKNGWYGTVVKVDDEISEED